MEIPISNPGVSAAIDDRRNRLVMDHLPMAGKIAGRLLRRLPGCMDRDDLIQAGAMALVECAHRFDESRGVPFEAYVLRRVKGAMLDELRRRDRNGGLPPDEDCELQELPARNETRPDEIFRRREIGEVMDWAIDALPAKERTILERHYRGEIKLRLIGETLGISPEWVSQLHHVALKKLAWILSTAGIRSCGEMAV